MALYATGFYYCEVLPLLVLTQLSILLHIGVSDATDNLTILTTITLMYDN